MKSPKFDSKGIVEYYDRIRARVQHEDGLVNQRLIWMITLQGLIFTAYGFSLGAQANAIAFSAPEGDKSFAFSALTQAVEKLRTGMSIVGMLSSFLALLGVVAAYRSIRDDECRLRAVTKDSPIKLPLPSVIGRRMTNRMGMASGLFVPFLTGGAWVYIGGYWDRWFVGPLGGVLCVVLICIAYWPFRDDSITVIDSE